MFPLSGLFLVAASKMLDRHRSKEVDTAHRGRLGRPQRHSSRRRVSRTTANVSDAFVEVEIFPRQSQHLAHTPALTEQQRDRGPQPELLRRDDQRLRVGCGQGAPRIHPRTAGRSHEIERVGRDQPKSHRLGKGLPGDLARVQHRERRELVELPRLPFDHDLGVYVDDPQMADVIGEVAAESLVAVERRRPHLMAGDRFEPPLDQLGDRRLPRELARGWNLRGDLGESLVATGLSLSARRGRRSLQPAPLIAVSGAPASVALLAVGTHGTGLEVD